MVDVLDRRKGATMPDDRIAPSGALEGGGAYNRYASLPARGGVFAVPHLENAARIVALDSAGPIVIADCGSSQVRNSFAPIRAAIAVLQTAAGWSRPSGAYRQSGSER